MKHLLWIILGIGLGLVPVDGLAAGSQLLADEADRINYSVGYQVGGDFKKQGLVLKREALIKGVEDALSEMGAPLLAPEEMQKILVDLKKKIVADQERQKALSVEKYRGEGRDFLAVNAKKPGVVSLPSGLQYKVLTAGSGRSPTVNDTVTVNYRGTLVDGSEFDSSFRDGKPATFPLNSVIAGWREAIQLMKEGARWQLFIPADLAFGERGPLADRIVIYELELLGIEPADKGAGEPPPLPPQKPADKGPQ